MTREKAEQFTLELNVGYNKNDRISMQQLKECILNEELDKYSTIAFNPESTYYSDMVGLIEKRNSYIVFKTGERGSGNSVEFKDKGLALNYMLALLRLRKQVSMGYENENKKM